MHALPFFAAVMTALFLADAGFGFGAALICGGAVALAALTYGRTIVAQAISPMLRVAISTAFAAPASVVAYHAVLGLTAPVIGSEAVRTMAAIVIALWSEVWRGATSPVNGCRFIDKDVARSQGRRAGRFATPTITVGSGRVKVRRAYAGQWRDGLNLGTIARMPPADPKSCALPGTFLW